MSDFPGDHLTPKHLLFFTWAFPWPPAICFWDQKEVPIFSMLLGLPREGVENTTIELEAVETWVCLWGLGSFVCSTRIISGRTFYALRNLPCPSAWVHVGPGYQEQGADRGMGGWSVVVVLPQVKDLCGTLRAHLPCPPHSHLRRANPTRRAALLTFDCPFDCFLPALGMWLLITVTLDPSGWGKAVSIGVLFQLELAEENF